MGDIFPMLFNVKIRHGADFAADKQRPQKAPSQSQIPIPWMKVLLNFILLQVYFSKNQLRSFSWKFKLSVFTTHRVLWPYSNSMYNANALLYRWWQCNGFLHKGTWTFFVNLTHFLLTLVVKNYKQCRKWYDLSISSAKFTR